MEEGSKVEIVVISAENLKFHDSGFFKHNTFVTVRADPFNFGTTPVDSNGESFPSWNEPLELTLGSTVRSIRVEVYCKTAFGVKMIGEAEVPVSDFTGDLTPAGYLHFLSYRLRDKEGRKSGIINLSVRVHGLEHVCGSDSHEISTGKVPGGGFPVRQEVRPFLNHIPAELVGTCSMDGKEGTSGIAVGIPVAHGYPF